MKQSINKYIACNISAFNEIDLFRFLMNELNTKYCQACFVDEVHAHSGFIEFDSVLLGAPKKVEIADLQIISYNKHKKELRLCFLQAKLRKQKYRKFLNFPGDIYQWELLKGKPAICDTFNHGFPTNILNFTKYQSITSFGVFYKDLTSNFDMLYTMPVFLTPTSAKRHTTLQFNSPCKGNITSTCNRGFSADETVSLCSINPFVSELLNGRIGAPVLKSDLGIMLYIASSIASVSFHHPNNSIAREILSLIDMNVDGVRKNHMKTILIVSNNESKIDDYMTSNEISK